MITDEQPIKLKLDVPSAKGIVEKRREIIQSNIQELCTNNLLSNSFEVNNGDFLSWNLEVVISKIDTVISRLWWILQQPHFQDGKHPTSSKLSLSINDNLKLDITPHTTPVDIQEFIHKVTHHAEDEQISHSPQSSGVENLKPQPAKDFQGDKQTQQNQSSEGKSPSPDMAASNKIDLRNASLPLIGVSMLAGFILGFILNIVSIVSVKKQLNNLTIKVDRYIADAEKSERRIENNSSKENSEQKQKNIDFEAKPDVSLDKFGFPIEVKHQFFSTEGYSPNKNYLPNLERFIGRHSDTMQEVPLELNREALDNFINMKKAAAKDDVTLTACAAYRGLDYQKWLRDERPGRAAESGFSEHHLGTTVDIIGVEWNNDAYNWLIKNASEFGYILPLFQGHKIEGQIAEANHWRYVGKDEARQFVKRNKY